MMFYAAAFFTLIVVRGGCRGLSPAPPQIGRRIFLEASSSVSVIAAAAAASPLVASAAVGDPPPAPYRDVDVGGGYDLYAPKRGAADGDAVYPESIEGTWECQRVVARVEGDKFQAGEAYRCLGGGASTLREGAVETFPTRYVRSPVIASPGVVVDRGFEISSRVPANDVRWNAEEPNVLRFNNDKVKLIVVKRSVEAPTDQGFGFDELLRVEDGITTRAVQVKRRYRRSYDDRGNRVIEGLEIMKTFRVLDGIAGTELPTSTVKSQLRLVRPPS